MIFNILILLVCFYALGKWCGMIGVWGGVSTVLFVFGLITEKTSIGALGIISFLMWFVCMGYKTSNPKHTAQRTKKQMEEEENYGIIDFSKEK